MNSLHPYLAAALLSMIASAVAADRLVDPTRPANARAAVATVAATNIKVEAIMLSNGRPLAIVNGKVVRAGDSVGAVQIEEILSDGVRFKREGRSQVAYVNKQAISVRRNVNADGDRT